MKEILFLKKQKFVSFKALPDCRYMSRPDGHLMSMEQVEFAQSQGECESLCDQTRVFTCRAYSFTADENRCYLSGDDSISQMITSGILCLI